MRPLQFLAVLAFSASLWVLLYFVTVAVLFR